MAASVGVKLFRPYRVWLVFNVLTVTLIIIAGLGIIRISRSENQKLVERQLETLVRSRIVDLERREYRSFVEGIGKEFTNLFASIEDHGFLFQTGNLPPSSVCAQTLFHHSAGGGGITIKICRPYRSPAFPLAVLIGAFVVLSAISLKFITSLEHSTFKALVEFIENSGVKVNVSQGLMGILEKIKHIKEKLDEARQREMEVAKAEALVKTATHVAHDLASPLSSVQTSLDIFKEIPSPDKKTLNAIHLLELGSKRLGSISKELLDQHKGDRSKPSLFHLSDVLEELVKEYELQESYGGVAFIRDYSLEPVSIYGDRIKIQRVFGNLIKNAVEAMDKCGELTLTTCVANGSVVAEIKDTGCGMSEEVLQKVLNGGFTMGKENGHGIGLSSVRKILEEHKGKLSAESEIGIGTVFRVELPIKKESTEDRGEPTKGYHVLVIDDDKTIRLAWELIQERLHIEKLHLFPNLESLLESGLDLASIDIAFVDKNITNSRHDGAEVVLYLKSRGVAKVVLASGESEKQLREDPAFSQADFIVGEKIPRSFKEFFS